MKSPIPHLKIREMERGEDCKKGVEGYLSKLTPGRGRLILSSIY